MKKILIPLITFLLFTLNVNSQSINTKAEALINAYVEQEKFTGTVLVSKAGEIILHKGYGLLDAAAGKPNSINSIFQVASLAKQFTAAVILKLQEMGKLSVQDKIIKYYPDYPNGDKISIHQLLSHTSGIYNYTDNKVFMSADQSKPVTLDFMIDQFVNKPLNFEPGSKFSYSNSGYTMLGYIIEKITGKTYRQVLEDLILKPIGMKNTGYDYMAFSDSNKTIGYNQYGNSIYKEADKVHSSILYTTGALYSTSSDLYLWHKALMGHSLLSASSLKSMYKPVLGAYAYGWQSDSIFGKQRLSHSGNVAGFKANINRIPEDDVCVIVLSNSSTSQVGQLAMALMSVIYDKPYQLPIQRKSIQLSAEILRQFTGTYRFNDQLSMEVTVLDNRLFIQPSGQPKFELSAESETFFFLKDYDMQFEFKLNTESMAYDKLNFYRNKQILSGSRLK